MSIEINNYIKDETFAILEYEERIQVDRRLVWLKQIPISFPSPKDWLRKSRYVKLKQQNATLWHTKVFIFHFAF